MFKRWEDYTELEQLAVTYSDLFKDVNGCRPRFDQSSWTVTDYEQVLDGLQADMENELVYQREREMHGVNEFEGALELTQTTCNCDRATAWRYLQEAEGDDWDDNDYYEFNNNLPAGYIASQLEVVE